MIASHAIDPGAIPGWCTFWHCSFCWLQEGTKLQGPYESPSSARPWITAPSSCTPPAGGCSEGFPYATMTLRVTGRQAGAAVWKSLLLHSRGAADPFQQRMPSTCNDVAPKSTWELPPALLLSTCGSVWCA